MTKTELISKIQELGLSNFTDEILASSRPCLNFNTNRADSPISALESKIGGDPELPDAIDWPLIDTGEPMLFLARLAEVDIKKIYPNLTGYHLLFFAHWEYNNGAHIIKVPSDIPVKTRKHPDRPPDTLKRLHECSLQIEEAIALPNARDEFESWRYSEELRTFGLERKELDYWPGHFVTTSPLEMLVDQHYGTIKGTEERSHRAFGYPLYDQGHPAESAEQRFTPHWYHTGIEKKSTFIQNASQWMSILSLNTDENAELYFSDTGSCGYLVTESALKSANFDEPEFYQDEC